jgi:hypothetical protein
MKNRPQADKAGFWPGPEKAGFLVVGPTGLDNLQVLVDKAG